MSSYTGKTNSWLSGLLSIKSTIQSDKEGLVTTTFDIANQKIEVERAENTLSDAKDKLSYAYIRAPFDGVVAKINVKKGDSVSSGAAVMTFITKQRIAEISLNEVDIAKVKAGQKVTLTFDAVSDLSITGEVAEIDAIGTVSQGVVSYAVKINFDTQDERVKPGMSLSAAIITEMKQDVLLVPNSAVKSSGDINYVEMPNEEITASATGANGITLTTAPRQQQIQIGLANDSYTEVTSGLKEGDKVIAQTITSTSATSTNSSGSNSLRIPGVGGFRN